MVYVCGVCVQSTERGYSLPLVFFCFCFYIRIRIFVFIITLTAALVQIDTIRRQINCIAIKRQGAAPQHGIDFLSGEVAKKCDTGDIDIELSVRRSSKGATGTKPSEEENHSALTTCYMQARNRVLVLSDMVRWLLGLMIAGILFYFFEGLYISLNDQRFIQYGGLAYMDAVLGPFLAVLTFGPIVYLNHQCVSLEFETSRRDDIAQSTKLVLTQLVRDYPIFYSMFGVRLTPGQFFTAVLSLLAPLATKLLQYMAK
jgi:hypothetical protein